ncbi:MAG: heavy metal translocating P-type ATPase metal-binding domain-containing protein [Rhodopila sp.]
MSTTFALPLGPAEAAETVCAHCGLPVAAGQRFCCPGCEAAHGIIQGLGLGRYYQQRLQAIGSRALRPEPGERWDLARHLVARPDGGHELTLAVDGLQCGVCVWLIESVLAKQPGVEVGRVNMTTRRLRLAWRGAAEEADRLVGVIEALGYRLVPFDTTALNAAQDQTGRMLIRCLAVAGFAAGNVMFISIGIWAGQLGGLTQIGSATEALLHWVSALLAMPAVAYAGRPFFASAWAALRQRRTNMNVPISIGVLLVTGMSMVESI